MTGTEKTELKDVDLSTWDTSKVVNVADQLYGRFDREPDQNRSKCIIRLVIFAVWTYLITMFALGLMSRSSEPMEAPVEPVEPVEHVGAVLDAVVMDQASLEGVEWMFSRWAVE